MLNKSETVEPDDLSQMDTKELLREMVRLLREVDRNTRTLPGFIKTVRDVFAKFVGDLDKHVMKK